MATGHLPSPIMNAKQFHKPEKDKDGYLIPVVPKKVLAPPGFVTAVEFYNYLNGELGYPFILDDQYLLILDSRTNCEYLECHIATARMHTDIHIVFECLLDLGKLDAYSFIVIYDYDGSGVNVENSQLMKTYKEIREQGHDVEILLGGIQQFSSKFPFLCTDKIINTEPDRRRLLKNYPAIVFDDFLFQGNGEHAIDNEVFINLKITHVVNISVEVPNAFPEHVVYFNIQVTDEISSKILTKLSAAADFIAESIANGGRVFVHCVLGASRSSTVTIAYLMKYHAWTLEGALRYLKECRQCISPNRGFLCQLSKFEEELYGKVLTSIDHIWV
ncbi:putative rhodanese domain-containing dual specificity protein phosphatase [Saccoglossus kowalevskii]|uniref:protein-tyrosine-phosphatase n=1 Tax=Saccoglossus kowalevskii TaxID=10224 RepID=A0ABM0GIF3_SACKO|nr:PREDICTED: probable rhodanese domain-containing dual specificity protein phosphatase-like [Saccoglossus kowalevskii]